MKLIPTYLIKINLLYYKTKIQRNQELIYFLFIKGFFILGFLIFIERIYLRYKSELCEKFYIIKKDIRISFFTESTEILMSFYFLFSYNICY